MFKNRKAQAAIEYLMVFGIALLISTPFIVKAQQSVMEIKKGSEMLEARNTLNQIESAAETVNAAGDPARRTFKIRMPDSVQSSTVKDNYVGIAINSSDSYVSMSRSFEFNVTGELPESEGNYLVSTSAKNGEVDLEVVG